MRNYEDTYGHLAFYWPDHFGYDMGNSFDHSLYLINNYVPDQTDMEHRKEAKHIEDWKVPLILGLILFLMLLVVLVVAGVIAYLILKHQMLVI